MRQSRIEEMSKVVSVNKINRLRTRLDAVESSDELRQMLPELENQFISLEMNPVSIIKSRRTFSGSEDLKVV